jgi:hypothetical protein
VTRGTPSKPIVATVLVLSRTYRAEFLRRLGAREA